MLQRVKGTHDLLDLSLFNTIINRAHAHLTQYHFTQISTPILEHLDLFHRSLGELTDVVSKEMFIIASADEQKICLRPEATASTMRAFLENNVTITPWKVFSYGPMFRHERPQKGRYREFNQISLEIIGASSLSYDVQMIAMLEALFSDIFCLQDYVLTINFLGCLSDRIAHRTKLVDYLADVAQSLCANCQSRREKNPLRIFDCKNSNCQKLYDHAPTILSSLCAECQNEWQYLQDTLLMLSVTYTINPKLVRGLDYYSKTVFEFSSMQLGAQSTFCGGGRYDSLATQLGAKKDLPSIGAAIGIERLLLLLEPYKEALLPKNQPPLLCIMPWSSEFHPLALIIGESLRAHGNTVEILLDGDSIKSMMRSANRMQATYALLIGEEERATKSVSVKNLVTSEQQSIAQADLISFFARTK